MEASTSVTSLYRQLAGQGFNIVVSHPKKTRYIAEARIKSDRVDSKVIAELARLGSLPLAYVPSRAFLVRQRVKQEWCARGWQ
jgi:transposase